MGNLDFGVTEDELKNLLSPYGTVVAIKINKKKGYAFAEMGNAEEASKAVQGINGQKHKDREIRASLEMKPNKAKALSIQKYKERGWNLSKEKARARRVAELESSGEESYNYSNPESNGREWSSRPSYEKPKGDYRSKERSSDYSSSPRKSWSGSKPSYNPKPKRSWDRENKDTDARPEKREWAPKKPFYGAKPTRDGEKSSSPWTPKKTWSSKKTSGSSGTSSRSWGERPEKNKSPGDKPFSKPWFTGGTKKKFSKTARPDSGEGFKKSSYGSSRPKPHRGKGYKDRSSHQRDED